MALWRCTSCTCTYAVGLPRCPQCSGTEHEEDGAMPKSHKNRPPTNEAEPAPVVVEPAADAIVPKELRADYREAPSPRPTPRKRNHTRAQAGVARGSGKAAL